MSFGSSPTSTTTISGTPLTFPVSAVYVPNIAGSIFTAIQGGPVSTDGNGNQSAPIAAYIADGSNVTQGTSTDSANANTVMGQLKQIKTNTATGGSATGSVVPANAFYQAGNAATSLPTAASAGNLTGAMYDKFGRLVTLPNAMRDLVSPITQLTLTATTAETPLIAAVASTFLDLVSLVVINTSTSATQVDFRDSSGGTIRLSLYVPAGDTRGIALPVPFPQSVVNQAWTAKCGTSVSSIIITGSYISNK